MRPVSLIERRSTSTNLTDYVDFCSQKNPGLSSDIDCGSDGRVFQVRGSDGRVSQVSGSCLLSRGCGLAPDIAVEKT